MTSSATVLVLGAGAVGSALARRLLAAGRPVAVWNRTPARARPLAKDGAQVVDRPGDVPDAELVLVAGSGAAAVDRCLAELSGSRPDAVAVVGTSTPDEARSHAGRITALGAAPLGVGLQGSPATVATGEAVLLVGGAPAAYARHRDVLALVGRPRHVGPAAEAAAVWDLTLFGLWYDAQLGLLRALDAVRSAGAEPTSFADLAVSMLSAVVDGTVATAAEVRDGTAPVGPASVREHADVLRSLVALRAGSVLGDGGVRTVADLLDRLTADGRGGTGLSAVVRTP